MFGQARSLLAYSYFSSHLAGRDWPTDAAPEARERDGGSNPSRYNPLNGIVDLLVLDFVFCQDLVSRLAARSVFRVHLMRWEPLKCCPCPLKIVTPQSV